MYLIFCKEKIDIGRLATMAMSITNKGRSRWQGMLKEEIAKNLYKYFKIANICEINCVMNELCNQDQANINFVIMASDESIGELLLSTQMTL